MAILNRTDYRTYVSKNIDLFQSTLDNLQLNSNNLVMSKCTIYKLPSTLPLIIPHKTTTYYIFIEIVKATNSPSEIFQFVDSNLRHSKFFINSILLSLLDIYNYTGGNKSFGMYLWLTLEHDSRWLEFLQHFMVSRIFWEFWKKLKVSKVSTTYYGFKILF